MFFTSKKKLNQSQTLSPEVFPLCEQSRHIFTCLFMGFPLSKHISIFASLLPLSLTISTENPLSILTLAPNKLSLHHTNTRGKQGEERSLCLLPLPLFDLSFLPCSPYSLPHSTRASLFVRRMSFHVFFKLNATLSPLTATCMLICCLRNVSGSMREGGKTTPKQFSLK